jgi:hypothetical protein
MKISFLVLVACLCLTAVSAKKKVEQKVETNTFKNEHGLDVNAEKVITNTENVDVKTYQEGDAVVEEEVKTYRTSVQGKRKGKRKQEKWVQAELIPCSELLAPQKADCDASCNANQKCEFVISSEETCAWDCKCESIIVETVEEVVEQESELEGANGEVKRRKVKKEASGGKKKKIVKDGKECSGTKKLSFSNCLIKLKGLVAWGEETKDFDSKFNAL